MKPDYKNWVPKSMVYGLAGGTVIAFAAFLLLGATGTILQGTPRLVCGIVLGIGTLILLFFTVWMGALHRTFDYNGKRKLAKTIIDGTAKYVTLPDGGTGLDVGCGSGALTIASAKRNPKGTMVGCDIWSGAYRAVFTKQRCEDNAKAEGVTNVRFEEGKGTYNALLMKGTLTQHLIDTNEAALDMMETLVKQMAADEGVTEDLKRRDQMAWVGAMNSIRNRADEIVRAELIEV